MRIVFAFLKSYLCTSLASDNRRFAFLSAAKSYAHTHIRDYTSNIYLYIYTYKYIAKTQTTCCPQNALHAMWGEVRRRGFVPKLCRKIRAEHATMFCWKGKGWVVRRCSLDERTSLRQRLFGLNKLLVLLLVVMGDLWVAKDIPHTCWWVDIRAWDRRASYFVVLVFGMYTRMSYLHISCVRGLVLCKLLSSVEQLYIAYRVLMAKSFGKLEFL